MMPLDLSPYRSEFAGPSVGTEQELLGVRIGRKASGGSEIADVVSGGQVLVQITTDIGGGGDAPFGYLGYTMEIKTSPTEVTDVAGWELRRGAIREVIAAIADMVLVKGGSFTGGKLGAYDLVVHNGDHVVYGADTLSTGVSGSSRHATFGLPFALLGTEHAALVSKAGWYEDWSEEFDLIEGSSPWVDRDRSLRVYNYLRSVLTRLARLTSDYSLAVHDLYDLKGFTGNLYDSAIKNRWGVLPRTSPWVAIELLAKSDRERIRPTLLKCPSRVTDPVIWSAAVSHITQHRSLAGHTPKAPTYTEEELPGTLFEFRTGIPFAFKHAFVLVDDELGGFDGEPPPPRPNAPQEQGDLHSVIKGRRQSTEIFEDSDSDDSSFD
ncbi:actin cross-linking domain-containing toxin [Actinokineospora terrae]|uniref:Actin cross-linking domain-containing protein n=1 Tax=Actinokineospora terrae TaxID=155974 RepID=A0A1H9MRZ7_9PSEU|nr:actin cross-linking domain-containing toxin [Actinokineospora terrae]SER26408.1 Actin cross-linking domain-containing protein [Actinokineospora terrae]